MRGVLIKAAAACLMVLPAVRAGAHLSINKLWLDFTAGKDDRNDIVIRNDGKDRYYVTVTVSEIINPGTPEEKRVEESDPEISGLLVTPNRLVLDPGALRSIRVVSLNQNLKKDRIYRILISPQVGQIVAKDVDQQDERGLTIKMLAAYDVLVVAKPADASANVVAHRNDHDIVLTNQGNTNVLLAEGRICPPGVDYDPDKEKNAEKKESPCKSLEAQRLYAGNSVTIPISSPGDRVFVKTRSASTAEFKSQQF